jgi:hypothetical protein
MTLISLPRSAAKPQTGSCHAAQLGETREMVPNMDLSALFDEALAQRVSEANKAKIAASYAQFPSDYDDEIDWPRPTGDVGS